MEADGEDVVALLATLEGLRARLETQLPSVPEGVELVVHPSAAALALAQPAVPAAAPPDRARGAALRRRLADAAARSTCSRRALLEARASNVPGSREMLMLDARALYAQLAVGAQQRRPAAAAAAARALRRACAGRGSRRAPASGSPGQTAHARPAIARRLREGGARPSRPACATRRCSAARVLDLLAREEGEARRRRARDSSRPATRGARSSAPSAAARSCTPRAPGARTWRASPVPS